jgi:hypothetical protein
MSRYRDTRTSRTSLKTVFFGNFLPGKMAARHRARMHQAKVTEEKAGRMVGDHALGEGV